MQPGAKRARTGAIGRAGAAGQGTAGKRQQRGASGDLLPGGHGEVFGGGDVVYQRPPGGDVVYQRPPGGEQRAGGQQAGLLGGSGAGYHVLRAQDPPGYEVLCLLPGYMINEVKVGRWGLAAWPGLSLTGLY